MSEHNKDDTRLEFETWARRNIGQFDSTGEQKQRWIYWNSFIDTQWRCWLASRESIPIQQKNVELLSEAINLAELGDIDESTEAHGWGDWMRRAKAHINKQFDLKTDSYPLSGSVWLRQSTREWVLELTGKIEGTDFVCRHPAPIMLAPADVPGLPHMYKCKLTRGCWLPNGHAGHCD